ncbi:hypothetical protein EMIHUDRAFT_119625 [Emiliania huxleyi CCMP1516]|uniref:Uncharacterized protein n=2 Tax=Emiliania huxleyi TaxID=2903 RepID=A0A0D3ISH1_EMIH1|nr:hypothetical protein EMIHUDRAFT_119625 [Emiliania huxleyi CCMP1516]EOD14206.1 hypothetical protein EMIHUDRAFT_119625 [Emiliania huxleyi CCMP1516]|eukprot:XP_005766635.1 hypothetical protein EMIHUDRAFT_119625 [Emiliania huxleyi CCMP1516]
MLLAALLACRAFTAALSPARAPLLLSSPRVAAAAVAGGRTLAPRLTGAAVARGEDVAGSRPQIVAEEDVLAYVDSVLAADAAINHPLIPDKVERRMYGLVVRVVLRSLSIGLGALDESVLLGRVLRVRLEPSREVTARDAAMLEAVAAQAAARQPVLDKVLDRVLYANVVRFALRLLSDMLLSTSDMLLSSSDEVEKTFGPLVDELLRDDRINLRLVADGLERSTYLGVVRALLGVGAAVAGQARVDAFGLAVSASLR